MSEKFIEKIDNKKISVQERNVVFSHPDNFKSLAVTRTMALRHYFIRAVSTQPCAKAAQKKRFLAINLILNQQLQ